MWPPKGATLPDKKVVELKKRERIAMLYDFDCLLCAFIDYFVFLFLVFESMLDCFKSPIELFRAIA